MDFGAIAPYGRSFDEYCFIFGFDDGDRGSRILGVGDGPSSFNAVATKRGWQVVSIDPLYAHSRVEIGKRIDAVMEPMMAVPMTRPHWVWSLVDGPEDLRRLRATTAGEFLADFEAGLAAGRYVEGGFPVLPFADDAFDVAVCAHLLFSWSGVLDVEFHIKALEEMLRVAAEVRVFPIRKNLEQGRLPVVDASIEHLTGAGHEVATSILPGLPRDANGELLIVKRAPVARSAHTFNDL